MSYDHPFIHFVNSCPTPWHVDEYLVRQIELQKDGNAIASHSLDEAIHFSPNKKLFIHKAGLSIGVVLPESPIDRATIIATHTDSPCLKVKQKGLFSVENITHVNCEIYGTPVLASWLGRELHICGKIWGTNQTSSSLFSTLIPALDHKRSTRPFSCIIPHVAPHLDRTVNDQGLIVARQEGISPIISIHNNMVSSLEEYLLQRYSQYSSIAFSDLFVVPADSAKILCIETSEKGELILSPRLDNLSSVWAAYTAFQKIQPRSDGMAVVFLFLNHEEVGSETSSGAYSAIIQDIIDEILNTNKSQQKAQFRARSILLSADAAHAFHPLAQEKYDVRHKVLLGKGISVKINAQQRYSTPADKVASFTHFLHSQKIPYQYFISRNDIPSGTTVGPILSARLGIDAIDIGAPIVGMHAAVEMGAKSDIENLYYTFIKYVDERTQHTA